MVTSIARQSVIIKCNQQSSVLLGNYEFYYVSGLMKKLFNLDLNKEQEPEVLFETIISNIGSLEPKDEKEAYLIKLVSVYKPLPEYDKQMEELFAWGESEEHLWQVHI